MTMKYLSSRKTFCTIKTCFKDFCFRWRYLFVL